MVHNLRLKPNIDIDAIRYLQHSLGDGITPEDDEDAWGDDCSDDDNSEDDDDDMVVGAFYQVFSTR